MERKKLISALLILIAVSAVAIISVVFGASPYPAYLEADAESDSITPFVMTVTPNGKDRGGGWG